jgi:cellulose biosynthesis protein BcsQ
VLSRVRRDLVSRQVAGQLRDRFGALVAAAELPASVKVEESHSRFLPVVEWSPRCAVSSALASVADELFPCLQSRRVA